MCKLWQRILIACLVSIPISVTGSLMFGSYFFPFAFLLGAFLGFYFVFVF